MPNLKGIFKSSFYKFEQGPVIFLIKIMLNIHSWFSVSTYNKVNSLT